MRVRYQIGTGPVAARPAAATSPTICTATERGTAATKPPAVRERPTSPRAAAPRRQAAARRRLPTPVVAVALVLAAAGCASLEPVSNQALRIAPVLDVRHSAAVAHSHGHYALGRYHDGMRAWDKAVDSYWQAIAVDPRHTEAYNALGVALAQLGRHEDAELALRRAVAIEPERAHLRSNLGFVMLMADRPREAIVELRVAVKLDPANPTARSNLREAAARWESEPRAAGEVRTVAAPPATKTTAAAPAGRAPESGIAAEVAAVIEGTQTITVAAPITVADLAALLSGSVNVPAPLLATPPPTAPTARVFDQPTVPAWPVAVAPVSGTTQANAPTAAMPTAATLAAVDLGAALPDRASLRLELSNGNGVPGMAARLGQWLARQGVQANRLTNRRPFAQEQTVVEYRRGHEEAAWRVAQALPLTTQVGPALRTGLKSDVRVVLGRDWRTSAACMERNACPPAATVIAKRVP